ncbi:MAG: cytoskeletal protein CcmA (bactofilin family) [Psychroserpens sp.]|jgi:cytoskeletal protein CcmA (bactofilin family)
MLKRNLALLGLIMSLSSHADNRNFVFFGDTQVGASENTHFTTTYTPLIFGNTYITAGTNAEVYGDMVSNTYLVTGAGAIVEGNIQTGTAVTTGVNTGVKGNINASTAITLGASSVVDGTVCYNTALTLGAGSTTGGYNCSLSTKTYNRDQVLAAQDSYNALTTELTGVSNHLEPTMPLNVVLNPYEDSANIIGINTVVYDAVSLTTAAGITLTLNGDYDWVFNIRDMLSLGAGTKIVLANGSSGSVTWNIGGYASIGAHAEIVGTILANGYISTGANSKITAAGAYSVSSNSNQSYCGGLFSATSYVTLGASSTVRCVQDNMQDNGFSIPFLTPW